MQGETSQEKGDKQWGDCNIFPKMELNAVIFMPSPQSNKILVKITFCSVLPSSSSFHNE